MILDVETSPVNVKWPTMTRSQGAGKRNPFPWFQETVSAAKHAEFLELRPTVASLRRFATRSLKINCNHKFMHMNPIKSVPFVAFLRQGCACRPEACYTRLDSQFPNFQGANNSWRTSQKETVFGRNPTIASRSNTGG